MSKPLDRAIAALRPMPAEVEARCRERLEDLAQRFDRYGLHVEAAPRRKQGIATLQHVSRLAAELADALYALDPAIRSTLRAAIGQGTAIRRPAGFVERHDGEKLMPWHGPPGGWLCVLAGTSVSSCTDDLTATDDVPIWHRLRDLSAYSLEAAKLIPPDKGGHTNMVSERGGTPKGQLAIAGLELIQQRNELCDGKAKPITGGTESVLYRVVAAVYERATGEEAEARGTGLGEAVKAAAKLHKDQLAAVAAYESLPMECPPSTWQPMAAELSRLSEAIRTL